MGEYVAINGHPTWTGRRGAGPPTLLLHGGFTNSAGLIDVFIGLSLRSTPERAAGRDSGRSHIVPYEKPALVFELVTEFLRTRGEVNTMMPLRRHLA
jgi:hypothetical protein